jgi:uncharacterized protein (DUF433 family)
MPTITDIGTLIVRSPDTCGDRPRMDGTRLTVHWIAIETQAGVTPEQILEERPYLTLAQIHAALAYYYANQEQIESEISADDAEYERLVAKARHAG